MPSRHNVSVFALASRHPKRLYNGLYLHLVKLPRPRGRFIPDKPCKSFFNVGERLIHLGV